MKILDLFNEYNLSPDMTWLEVEQPRTEKDRNTMSRMDKAYIVSKDFWWIKWLVDNDKIDRWKFEVEYTDKQTLKDVYIAWAKQDELIIMLLSISSSPIDDLISYLR